VSQQCTFSTNLSKGELTFEILSLQREQNSGAALITLEEPDSCWKFSDGDSVGLEADGVDTRHSGVKYQVEAMPVPGFHDGRAPNFDDVIAVNFDRQLHSAAGVRYGLTLMKTDGTCLNIQSK